MILSYLEIDYMYVAFSLIFFMVMLNWRNYFAFLPPASVVEVIESEPSFRECVCLSVNTLTAEPFDL